MAVNDWHPVGPGTPLNTLLEAKVEGEDMPVLARCWVARIGDDPEWFIVEHSGPTHKPDQPPTHWRWFRVEWATAYKDDPENSEALMYRDRAWNAERDVRRLRTELDNICVDLIRELVDTAAVQEVEKLAAEVASLKSKMAMEE